MGLDTSHDAWNGAYGAFSRWREAVAKAAGYAVARLEGDPHETILIDWGHVADKNYQGEWDEPPADPLMVLIAHSDCDGVIHPVHAGPLADRLEALLPDLSSDGEGHLTRYGGYQGATERFIKGLRAAAAAREDLEFH